MAAALLAVDWGTSNRRAAALDAQGRVLAELADGQGMLSLTPAEYEQSLLQFAGDWITPQTPILICGMAGSRKGWAEAPYLACPADPKALAGALLRAPSRLNAWLVPGVCDDQGHEPDVMRGEETKVFGLGLADGVVLSPGTHPKWIFLQQGRIAHFRSYLTGELFAALSGEGSLAQLMEPGPFDEAAFLKGVARARASGDLTHALFGVRTNVLLAKLKPAEAKSYLSGLLIGAEMADALSRASEIKSLTAIGSPGLLAHYQLAAGAFGLAVSAHEAESLVPAALYRMALAAGLLQGKD